MFQQFRPLYSRLGQFNKLWQIVKPQAFSGRIFPRMVRLQSTVPAPKEKGIKALVKEYGYSALGVYFLLSMLDLPICYAIVHSAGKEQIQVYENKVKQYFGFGKTDEELQRIQEIQKIEEQHEKEAGIVSSKDEGMFSWFSWTEFAIAYGIHKSVFIFVRVPLTAAITPSIVKMLRGWGFQIGKKTVPALGVQATKKHKWFFFF